MQNESSLYGFGFAYLWWARLIAVDTSLTGRDQSLSLICPADLIGLNSDKYIYHIVGPLECHLSGIKPILWFLHPSNGCI